MKKFLSLTLVVIMCVCMALPIYATSESILPRYNNVANTRVEFVIDSTGIAIAFLGYEGYDSDTTGATVTCKIEKRTLFWWSDVDGAEWSDDLEGSSSSIQYIYQLSKTGKYRLTYEITVYGTGGAPDVITGEIEQEY